MWLEKGLLSIIRRNNWTQFIAYFSFSEMEDFQIYITKVIPLHNSWLSNPKNNCLICCRLRDDGSRCSASERNKTTGAGNRRGREDKDSDIPQLIFSPPVEPLTYCLLIFPNKPNLLQNAGAKLGFIQP